MTEVGSESDSMEFQRAPSNTESAADGDVMPRTTIVRVRSLHQTPGLLARKVSTFMKAPVSHPVLKTRR